MNKLTFFAFTALLLAIASAEASAFTFTITAGSHLDKHTNRDLYQQTLRAAAAEQAGIPL